MNDTDPPAEPGDVTILLNAIKTGEDDGYGELIPLVYSELRGIARRLLSSERADHTLSPTALVHEAYVKLVKIDRLDWNGRTHFFAIAATAMRRLLVDHGKAYRAQKRSGGRQRVELLDDVFGDDGPGVDVVALNDSLEKLEQLDARQARVVELRFFGGLKTEEIASVLEVSPRTVKNDWRLAKLWLLRELSHDDPNASSVD